MTDLSETERCMRALEEHLDRLAAQHDIAIGVAALATPDVSRSCREGCTFAVSSKESLGGGGLASFRYRTLRTAVRGDAETLTNDLVTYLQVELTEQLGRLFGAEGAA